MDKLYRFYSYTKNYGLLETLGRTKRYAQRRLKAERIRIDVMADVKDVIAADFRGAPYKRPSVIPRKDSLEIAWVLSPLSAGSGGQNTITRFARYLQDQGHIVTFYIYEGVQAQSLKEASTILEKSFKLDVSVKKIADFIDADAVIATGWETAYPVFNLRTKAHKFYFVQDFEPYFYGLGSRSVLASNTYKFGFYGITAGKWLTHKLSKEYGMDCDYFNFGADLDIYRLPEGTVKKKKICFYARPVTERRAFEMGIMALEVFHEKHPEYEIEFIGWDVSMYKISFPYKNRGIITHQELAELYAESVACLVLSLTNVSLLPLELLAAGCIPVMNDGENNRMVLGEGHDVEYAENTPLELARHMSDVVSASDSEINIRAFEASKSVSSLSWEASYKKVEKIIAREVFGA